MGIVSSTNDENEKNHDDENDKNHDNENDFENDKKKLFLLTSVYGCKALIKLVCIYICISFYIPIL